MSYTYNFYLKLKFTVIGKHLKTFQLFLLHYDVIITQNM